MAHGNCVECAVDGRENPTELVLDGHFVFAWHAKKIQASLDDREERPFDTILKSHLKSVVKANAIPTSTPVPNRQTSRDEAQVRPELVKPAEGSIDVITFVPVSQVPELRHSAQDRLDLIFRALCQAPSGQAVKLELKDKAEALRLLKALQKRLVRAGFPYHSRTVDGTLWVWQREVPVDARAGAA